MLIYLVAHVVVQFYPWFKFYFPLFLGMVMYDNEFKTKENKIGTKGKIEPQHIFSQVLTYSVFSGDSFLKVLVAHRLTLLMPMLTKKML